MKKSVQLREMKISISLTSISIYFSSSKEEMHVAQNLQMWVTRSFTGSSSCPVRFYATLIRRARIPVRQVSHVPFAHRTRLLRLPRREFTDQQCTQGQSVESTCNSRKSRNIHLPIARSRSQLTISQLYLVYLHETVAR